MKLCLGKQKYGEYCKQSIFGDCIHTASLIVFCHIAAGSATQLDTNTSEDMGRSDPRIPRVEMGEPIRPGCFTIGNADGCLAFFGDEQEPRTRCALVVEVNRRRPLTPIPALTSLSDICRLYPKHIIGSGLKLFVKAGWNGKKIYEKMNWKDRPMSMSKDPSSGLSNAVNRKRREMEAEAAEYDSDSEGELSDDADFDEQVERPYSRPLVDHGEQVSSSLSALSLEQDDDDRKTREEARVANLVTAHIAPDQVGTEAHWLYVQLALQYGWSGSDFPIEELEALARKHGDDPSTYPIQPSTPSTSQSDERDRRFVPVAGYQEGPAALDAINSALGLDAMDQT
jgi:hypothetical protein